MHFAKLNVSCWFDGSDLVGIEHWGYRRPQWCMKQKPADWQPLPEVYRREREKQAAIERFRTGAQVRARELLVRLSEGRQSARDTSRCRTAAGGNAHW